MNDSSDSVKLTMHETQGCLVAPIQEELSRESALRVQRKILERTHSKSLKGVVIDLAGVQVIDRVLWNILANTACMIEMLGYHSVITGLNPGVVASIIDLDLSLGKVTTALRIEDGLKLLASTSASVVEENSGVEEEVEEYLGKMVQEGADIESL
ncbi:MAG: rsbT antagonist protein RsbS [Pseudohongiellaceae bacterium]|jgi:rsbT antagonist protein RsbS